MGGGDGALHTAGVQARTERVKVLAVVLFPCLENGKKESTVYSIAIGKKKDVLTENPRTVVYGKEYEALIHTHNRGSAAARERW